MNSNQRRQTMLGSASRLPAIKNSLWRYSEGRCSIRIPERWRADNKGKEWVAVDLATTKGRAFYAMFLQPVQTAANEP